MTHLFTRWIFLILLIPSLGQADILTAGIQTAKTAVSSFYKRIYKVPVTSTEQQAFDLLPRLHLSGSNLGLDLEQGVRVLSTSENGRMVTMGSLTETNFIVISLVAPERPVYGDFARYLFSTQREAEALFRRVTTAKSMGGVLRSANPTSAWPASAIYLRASQISEKQLQRMVQDLIEGWQ